MNMARSAGGTPTGGTHAYVPKVDGNEEDPDPVTVGIRYPSEEQRRRFVHKTKAMESLVPEENDDGSPVLDEDGKPKLTISPEAMHSYRKIAIEECVVWVRNYTRPVVKTDEEGDPVVDGDGYAVTEEVPINDGRDYAEYANTEFFNDVGDEILTGYSLSPQEKKRSRKLSVSGRQSTKASSGTAKSAERKGSRGKGAANRARRRGKKVS